MPIWTRINGTLTRYADPATLGALFRLDAILAANRVLDDYSPAYGAWLSAKEWPFLRAVPGRADCTYCLRPAMAGTGYDDDGNGRPRMCAACAEVDAEW